MIKRKITTVALLAILLAATFSSASAMETSLSEESTGLIPAFVKSEIGINATQPQINVPIANSETKTFDINVKYRMAVGPVLNWFFLKRRIGRALLFGPKYAFKFLTKIPSATINLSVEGPDWCQVALDNSLLNFSISNKFSTASAKVTLTIVNSSGHALEMNQITVNAEFKDNWRIKGSSNSTTISFLPAYVSSISTNVEMLKNQTEIPISPVNETAIPINITNNGNGDTIVNIQVENPPQNWSISAGLENITLSVGEKKQIDLIVNPYGNFDNETIKLKLTPKSNSDADVDDKYLQGTPIYLSITVINNRPEKEEGGISAELLIIIVIAVVILIFVLILLFKRKQQ